MEKRVIDRFIEQKGMKKEGATRLENGKTYKGDTLEGMGYEIGDPVEGTEREYYLTDKEGDNIGIVYDAGNDNYRLDRFRRTTKGDKQLDYANQLKEKIDREATTFDKPHWSNPGKKPGAIYRSASNKGKEAKMNIKAMLTDMWDRGMIGNKTLEVLKASKNEKLVLKEIQKIAKKKGYDIRVADNTDGQVSTKDRHGYPDGDRGETRKGPSVEGTEQRLPGTESAKSPANFSGNERRMPGVKEGPKEPWTGWKEKYNLRENDIVDSPTPASSGGTDKRLPGVKEKEFSPKGPYPSTQAKKRVGQELREQYYLYLTNALEGDSYIDPEWFPLTSKSEVVGQFTSNLDTLEAGMDIVVGIAEPGVSDWDPTFRAASDKTRRSIKEIPLKKAQHRTPQELMKEKVERDRKIEGMPHEPKIDSSKQEDLGEPETKIKEQGHGKTTDSLDTVGEVNPNTGISDVKGTTPDSLGYPESQTSLSKSLRGFFTGIPVLDGNIKEGEKREGQIVRINESFLESQGVNKTKLLTDVYNSLLEYDKVEVNGREIAMAIAANSKIPSKIDYDIDKDLWQEVIASVKEKGLKVREIESQTSLSKSLRGFFTGVKEDTGTERIAEGEPKFEWSGIPGETNQAPTTVTVTPPLSEQKSTTVPSIGKGEDNQPPSKSALAVHCKACKEDLELSEDGYNEWIKDGKTICRCGNLIEAEYDMTIAEDLFSGVPKEGEDRALTGKKVKARKPQCNWEIKY